MHCIIKIIKVFKHLQPISIKKPNFKVVLKIILFPNLNDTKLAVQRNQRKREINFGEQRSIKNIKIKIYKNMQQMQKVKVCDFKILFYFCKT